MKEEIENFSEKYHLRLSAHPNQLATDLLKAIKRKLLKDLKGSTHQTSQIDLTHIDSQESCKVMHC
jgi:hypothetical protein